MPVCSCPQGLLLTALATLLLLPAQYLLPDFDRAHKEPPLPVPRATPAPHHKPASRVLAPAPPAAAAWPPFEVYFPTLDLVFTVSLILLGLLTYLCEWIQRKLMERRISKLNQYLSASVERLRAWDEQQERLEATLRMVQDATSEYNLLLYLLLRQHPVAPDPRAPPPPPPLTSLAPADTPRPLHKQLDDRQFLRSPVLNK